MLAAIEARGLGKTYPPAHDRVGRYGSLRDRVTTLFRRRGRPEAMPYRALHDVSFDVSPGEVVGLIGRNGAGKSTLLRVLAGITRPTEGRAVLRGRVASLLEIGAGFHLELTGRENVYLGGTLLGLSRREVARHFDDIVAVAGVAPFLDLPLKRYSSGMYLRLAFAVASRLPADVLLLDEVFAVGDVTFQRVCLDHVRESARTAGRTTMVVSHDLTLVPQLCPRALLLDQGLLLDDGPVDGVLARYLGLDGALRPERAWLPDEAPGDEVVRLHAVRVLGGEGKASFAVRIDEPLTIQVEFEVLRPGQTLTPRLSFRTGQGACAFTAHEDDPQWANCPRPVGCYLSETLLPEHFLNEGPMVVSVEVASPRPVVVHARAADAVAFHVVEVACEQGARGNWPGVMPGVVRPRLVTRGRLREGLSRCA